MQTTIDEFIALLPNTGWKLNSGGFISRKEECTDSGIEMCPLTYIAFIKGLPVEGIYNSQVLRNAGFIGMRTDDAAKIVAAADNLRDKSKVFSQELRDRMLRQCGLLTEGE